MRRLLIVEVVVAGVLIAAALPCAGERPMTVAQLEKLLASETAGHRRDVDIAKKISEIEMGERISASSFERLSARLQNDPQAQFALRLVADESQFMELPAGEAAGDAAPDGAAQARMLDAAREFASKTLPGLPNFLATRTVHFYDDTPHALKKDDWPTRLGLHMVGAANEEISVSRERSERPRTQSAAMPQSPSGLVSAGEFGSSLEMILTDVLGGSMHWSHWERSNGTLLAVFDYAVPENASHFELMRAYRREAALEAFSARSGSRDIAGINVRRNAGARNVEVTESKAAYRGSIWLSPDDGVIRRVTLEADTSKGAPFRRAAILVEYGPVEIAGGKYVCPVRSFAFSQAPANAETLTGDAPTEWLNETLFTNYHRFGSSARIVTEMANGAAAEKMPENGQDGAPESATSAVPAAETAPTGPQQAEGEQVPQAGAVQAEQKLVATSVAAAKTNAVGSETQPAQTGTAATPAAQTVTQAGPSNAANRTTAQAVGAMQNETSGSGAAKSEPGQTEARKSEAPDSGFTLHVDVQSVLVPTVVTDKNGRAVDGLKQADFAVSSDGKPMAITGFTLVHHERAAERVSSAANEPSANETAAPSGIAAGMRKRFLIFLFDDRHMSAEDLPRVQKAARALLAQPLAETDYADVLSFMGVSSGITRDPAVLDAAVMKMTVHPLFQHAKEDCPDVDYYAADKIVRQHDPMEFQIAVGKAKQCMAIPGDPTPPSANIYAAMSNPTDVFQRAAMAAASRALAEGEEDTRDSLLAVENVVRAMAKLPGQRVLILVSPGFLTMTPSAMVEKSDVVELAAESEVVVNTMDARGLYTGNVDASQGGATSTLALMTGAQVSDKLGSMEANENALAEIADGTGGKFFHNNNDLTAGLETLTAAPESLYLLEVSLKDVKANGVYHGLKVKVDRPGMDVVARKGFLAPTAERGKKKK